MTEYIVNAEEEKLFYGDKYEKLVRCKDCDNRHTDDCPMYHEEWYEIDEGNGFVDNDFTTHDYSQDDGFCSWAKMKGGTE